jgi:hypothetical protein
MSRLMTLTILAAGLPALAGAQSFRHGRIRHVEDGVTIQRAAEATAEEAVANLPFLPGDRVWTDSRGRAEFQFEGGSLLRLDSGSKLDYLSHDDGRGERIVLRLWSGSLYLHARDRRMPEFEIETPGGVVAARTRGVYRVDAESGEVRLSVFEGEATLEGNEEVRVGSGLRVVAQRGEVADGPRGFDLTQGDPFGDWVQDRQERLSFAGERPAYLPEEVAPYADEFDSHGSWYYEQEVGHVWRPYVASGWRPYFDGRWVWTIYGWTWVPRETWGWAAFHYGRWGHSPAIGWYWIPGRQWGPGWVHWATGGDYLGWCPLGYRDRPVIIRERTRVRGHAIPRGTTKADVERPGAAWVYVKRGELSSPRGVASMARVEAPPVALQMVDPGRARLTRDLAVAEGTTPPRSVRTKPTVGDTVPEMRGHETPPGGHFPASRRRAREEGRYDTRTFGEAAVEPSKRTPQEDTGAGSGHMSTQREGSAWSSPRRNREESGEKRHEDPPAMKQKEEREVLRPLFGGLSRPRREESERHEGTARPRSHDNDGGRQRDMGSHRGGDQPRREASPPQVKQAAPPPPPPPPQQQQEHKKQREKKNHH